MSTMAPSQWVEVERLLAENARLLDQYQQAVNTNVFFLARAQEAEHEVESLKEANRKLANQIHTGGEGLLREAVEAVDDAAMWDAVEKGGFGDDDLKSFRAALLAALTRAARVQR